MSASCPPEEGLLSETGETEIPYICGVFLKCIFKNYIPCVLLTMPLQVIFTMTNFLRKDRKDSKIKYTSFSIPEVSDDILFNLNIVRFINSFICICPVYSKTLTAYTQLSTQCRSESLAIIYSNNCHLESAYQSKFHYILVHWCNENEKMVPY